MGATRVRVIDCSLLVCSSSRQGPSRVVPIRVWWPDSTGAPAGAPGLVARSGRPPSRRPAAAAAPPRPPPRRPVWRHRPRFRPRPPPCRPVWRHRPRFRPRPPPRRRSVASQATPMFLGRAGDHVVPGFVASQATIPDRRPRDAGFRGLAGNAEPGAQHRERAAGALPAPRNARPAVGAAGPPTDRPTLQHGACPLSRRQGRLVIDCTTGTDGDIAGPDGPDRMGRTGWAGPDRRNGCRHHRTGWRPRRGGRCR